MQNRRSGLHDLTFAMYDITSLYKHFIASGKLSSCVYASHIDVASYPGGEKHSSSPMRPGYKASIDCTSNTYTQHQKNQVNKYLHHTCVLLQNILREFGLILTATGMASYGSPSILNQLSLWVRG